MPQTPEDAGEQVRAHHSEGGELVGQDAAPAVFFTEGEKPVDRESGDQGLDQRGADHEPDWDALPGQCGLGGAEDLIELGLRDPGARPGNPP